jgi:hypothetical protein
VHRLDQISAFKAANLFDFKSLALKGRRKQIGRFKIATRTKRREHLVIGSLHCHRLAVHISGTLHSSRIEALARDKPTLVWLYVDMQGLGPVAGIS